MGRQEPIKLGHALKNALKTVRIESVKKPNIGKRIKELRGRESRPAFAGRFGISVATLARYETDETSPNAVFIMALCEEYSIDPDWLLYGKAAGQPERLEGLPGGPEAGPARPNGLKGGDGCPTIAANKRQPYEIVSDLEPDIKNEVSASNLTTAIKTLDCDDFDRLWNQFKSESEARRGWLQIEIIKRFPEFLEWLESRPTPLRRPPPAALTKGEPAFPYGQPPFIPED